MHTCSWSRRIPSRPGKRSLRPRNPPGPYIDIDISINPYKHIETHMDEYTVLNRWMDTCRGPCIYIYRSMYVCMYVCMYLSIYLHMLRSLTMNTRYWIHIWIPAPCLVESHLDQVSDRGGRGTLQGHA